MLEVISISHSVEKILPSLTVTTTTWPVQPLLVLEFLLDVNLHIFYSFDLKADKLVYNTLLINYQVHEAIKIAEEAFDSGVSLSLETYHLILEECIQSCELNLVRDFPLFVLFTSLLWLC